MPCGDFFIHYKIGTIRFFSPCNLDLKEYFQGILVTFYMILIENPQGVLDIFSNIIENPAQKFLTTSCMLK